MLPFVLAVLLLPGLILTDIQCPSGDLSCPEGKTCCMVEGKPSCCDEDLERAALLSNTSIVVQNGTWDRECNFLTCHGTCCSTSPNSCCSYSMATCCTATTCCDFLNTCCGGVCCPFQAKCCGNWCCTSKQRCGPRYNTCYNGATTMAPTTVVVSMVFLWLAIKVLPKM